MIRPDTIQSILEASRIEDVVGEFVSLKKRGSNLIGLCPFHNEKTPSFNVSPVRGIYKCFGCGKGGNAVNFLMEHEHYTYPEALKYLAKKYNIEVEEEVQTPELLDAQNEKESLFNLNQFARQYFSDNLWNKEKGKAIGLTYFRERGFLDPTITKFQLGFCLPEWDDFTRHALSKGYKTEFLVKTGLSIQKEERMYDRFHERVMFPIHNTTGRIIGFGGRILSSEKSTAKYVNSPESEIYNKSKSLYGLFFARNAIASKNECYLVEGYTDVISLHQAGIENVVASSGTSLTEDQIRLIRRYTPNITILYDGDPAGIKASFRGIDMILEQGMNVKIVLFPDQEDPDSFVRKHTTTDAEHFITSTAVSFILFKTKTLLQEAGSDPIQKALFVKEIIQSIALIPDVITRSVYVRECSSLLNVPEQSLMNEINHILRKNFYKKGEGETVPVEIPEPTEYTAEKQLSLDPDNSETQEKELIRLMLLYGTHAIEIEQMDEEDNKVNVEVKVAEVVLHFIKNDRIEFQNPVYDRIMREFEDALAREYIPDDRFFMNFPDPGIAGTAIELVSTPYELSPKWEKIYVNVQSEETMLKKAIFSSILSLQSKKLDQQISILQRQIRSLSSEDEVIPLLTELKQLKSRSQMVNERLGRIVIK